MLPGVDQPADQGDPRNLRFVGWRQGEQGFFDVSQSLCRLIALEVIPCARECGAGPLSRAGEFGHDQLEQAHEPVLLAGSQRKAQPGPALAAFAINPAAAAVFTAAMAIGLAIVWSIDRPSASNRPARA